MYPNIKKIVRNKYSAYFIFFLLIALQSYGYLEHIFSNYKLLNEYRYIDEVTLLKDKNVSNIEYINNNLLFDKNKLSEKFDSQDIYIDNSRGKGLYFRYPIKEIILTPTELSSYRKLISEVYNYQLPLIAYNNILHVLQSDLLLDTSIRFEDDLYIQDNGRLHPSISYYPLLSSKTQSELEEKFDFIKKNIYEQDIQILDRHYFHEGSFMLAPINEMQLARDNQDIFSQYGFLSIKLISYIMDLYGGFSINNFEKAKKTVDLLYYALTIILIFNLFQDNLIRLILLAIIGIAFHGASYFAFSYAPTVTNSRHILDVFVIFLLYLFDKNNKKIYLFLSIFFAIASLFIAKDFGQFIFLSLIGVLTIRLVNSYLETNKISIVYSFVLLLTGFFGILAMKYYPLMPNPSIKYFLEGFYSFPIKQFAFLLVLFIVFIQWMFLVICYNHLKVKNYLYSYIFLIFYTEFLFVYFIWNGTLHNVLMYSYLYALPLIIIYNLFNLKHKHIVSGVVLIGVVIMYLETSMRFYDEKVTYMRIFENHKTYLWNHPRAGGIIATYPFDAFEDSIHLIKKYNQPVEFYMISKYDNLLSIFSEKYSGFPFFELRSSIVTKEEYAKIKSIIDEKAEILFVDNDINRDFVAEMNKISFFDTEPYWRNESFKQRIPKLENLKNLFNDVKNDYILLEQGKLISVYKKVQKKRD